MNGTKVKLPKYKCHKEVEACKIGDIITIDIDAKGVHEAKIIPKDKSIEPLMVGSEFLKKHNPKVGGYIVMYEDGYISYSPAKAFEEGYTLMADGIVAKMLENERLASKNPFPKLTTENLTTAFQMAGIGVLFGSVDRVIDVVEIVIKKGGETTIDDISDLQVAWDRHEKLSAFKINKE